ncbi:MAG: MBL fold metallo-hydrolase [Bacteroidia bacterium]
MRLSKITHIFISHLHGDHYLGLVGLLSTMHLQGRTNEIHVYGQAELMDVIELQLRLSMTRLPLSDNFSSHQTFCTGYHFRR